ncbi:hypothetical protein GUITHDRAFT_154649, partial [Guillardia theta CCMP2712]
MSIQVQDFCFMSIDASLDSKQDESDGMNYGIFFLGSDSRSNYDGHTSKNQTSPMLHEKTSGKVDHSSESHVTISLCEDISNLHVSSCAAPEHFLTYSAKYSKYRPFRIQSSGTKGILLGNVRKALEKT